MPKFQDLTGRRFGRLVVIARSENGTDYKGRPVTRWRCICDCGSEIVTLAKSLSAGDTKSCGCLGSKLEAIRDKYGVDLYRECYADALHEVAEVAGKAVQA